MKLSQLGMHLRNTLYITSQQPISARALPLLVHFVAVSSPAKLWPPKPLGRAWHPGSQSVLFQGLLPFSPCPRPPPGPSPVELPLRVLPAHCLAPLLTRRAIGPCQGTAGRELASSTPTDTPEPLQRAVTRAGSRLRWRLSPPSNDKPPHS